MRDPLASLASEADAVLQRFNAGTHDALAALAARDLEGLAAALDARAEPERMLVGISRRLNDLRSRAMRDPRAAAELRAISSATALSSRRGTALQAELAERAEKVRAEIGEALVELSSMSSATASYTGLEGASAKRLDVRL